jgi:hypothetical protein
MQTTIVVPLSFHHKFLSKKIVEIVEILFIIRGKILIKLKVQLSGFKLWTFHDNDFKLKQST